MEVWQVPYHFTPFRKLVVFCGWHNLSLSFSGQGLGFWHQRYILHDLIVKWPWELTYIVPHCNIPQFCFTIFKGNEMKFKGNEMRFTGNQRGIHCFLLNYTNNTYSTVLADITTAGQHDLAAESPLLFTGRKDTYEEGRIHTRKILGSLSSWRNLWNTGYICDLTGRECSVRPLSS